MAKAPPKSVTEDRWSRLARLTAARIALGRAGMSLPTARHLEFQLAHARARDAVHAALDPEAFAERLRRTGDDVLVVASAAPDRVTYLQRPDLGRCLSPQSRALLDRRVAGSPRRMHAGAPPGSRYDAAFVIADGLSALAVERNSEALLASLRPRLVETGWRLAPLTIATGARVALGDEIGERLDAGLVAVLIGERPGLSAPDSLGVYLTFAPRTGRTDAERNCISNIRNGGISPTAAAATLLYLMTEARRQRTTGVELKDETAPPQLGPTKPVNFLIESKTSR